MAVGGQVAYYIILSFFPLLIFLLTLAAYFNLTIHQLFKDLPYLIPAQSYSIIDKVLTEVLSSRSPTLLSLSMFGAFWASLNGINALMRGIGKAYQIKETRSFIRFKLTAILFLIILFLAMILSFTILVFGEKLGNLLFQFFEAGSLFPYIWQKLRLLIQFCFLVLTFLILNQMATRAKYSTWLMFPGSLIAATGWVVISLAFSFYVRHFNNYSVTYGSIGGIIILILWIYWSSAIFLLSCAFNAVLIENKKKRR
ncbi:MAG: hypothetical protein APF84_14110 [Gracilibacter sp. BRH_c7a]|nr:MAG: hypothetical protein APF84_14110 [Gracilibacter sp. BRH_c7a]